MTNNQLTDERIERLIRLFTLNVPNKDLEDTRAALLELISMRLGSKREVGSDVTLSDERIDAIANGRAPRYRNEAQSMARELQERRKATKKIYQAQMLSDDWTDITRREYEESKKENFVVRVVYAEKKRGNKS